MIFLFIILTNSRKILKIKKKKILIIFLYLCKKSLFGIKNIGVRRMDREKERVCIERKAKESNKSVYSISFFSPK